MDPIEPRLLAAAASERNGGIAITDEAGERFASLSTIDARFNELRSQT